MNARANYFVVAAVVVMVVVIVVVVVVCFFIINQWKTDFLLLKLADADETNFQVTFPEQSVTDFIRFDLHRCVPPLTAFTVCLWLRTAQEGKGTTFSYSVPGNDNEIVIYDSANLKLIIGGDKR